MPVARFQDHLQVGDHASRPAATAVAVGTLYSCTDHSLIYQSDGATWSTYATLSGGGGGAMVQMEYTQSSAVATGTTTIPIDDTIPQNTEGTEFLTCAITPTDAGNLLRIDVSIQLSHSGSNSWVTAALFQDTTAGALAARPIFMTTAGSDHSVAFSWIMTAGTTSATTFKVRAGASGAGTLTFNGNAGGRWMGGVMASNIIITEIVP